MCEKNYKILTSYLRTWPDFSLSDLAAFYRGCWSQQRDSGNFSEMFSCPDLALPHVFPLWWTLGVIPCRPGVYPREGPPSLQMRTLKPRKGIYTAGEGQI